MSIDLDAFIDRELATPRYRRRSALLNDLFLKNTTNQRRQAAKHTLDFLVPLYAVLIIFDFILLPDVFIYSILMRWVVGPLMWLIIRGRKRASVEWIEWSIAAAIYVAMLMWTCLMLTSRCHSGAANYYSTGVVALVAANVFFRCPFRVSLTVSVALTVTLVALAALLPEDWRFFVNGFGLYSVVCILTLLASWKLGNEHYVNFLQTLKNERQQATIERHVADLFRLSNTDALTGLANRRSIDETLRHFWLDWTERGQAFAVILVDVDFFKRFNDAHGHQAGDACLVKVAKTLNQVIDGRPGLVGRYGGEEFIALLRCESGGEVLAIAQAMRRAVEDLGLRHGNRPDDGTDVTVSLGVAISQDVAAPDPEAIVALADQALYFAKAEGRNCTRLVAPDAAPVSTIAA